MMRAFSAVVAAGLAVGLIAPTVADDERTVDVSFEELPPGWEVDWADGGAWFVDGGMLVGVGHAWFSYVEHDWEDLEVEFTTQMSGGLHVNVRAGEDRYRFALRQDAGGTRIEIWRDGDGMARRVVASEPIDDDGDLDVSIAVIGGLLEITAGDVDLSWTDPAPLPPGRFGFESLPDTDWVQIGPVRLVGTVPSTPAPPPTRPTEPPSSADGPDLALVELAARPISAGRLEVTATIRNIGDTDARVGTMLVEFHDDPLGEFALDEWLDPGAEVSITRGLDVPARWWSSAGAVTAWVETTDDVDGSNNWRTLDLQLPSPEDPEPARPPATTPGGKSGTWPDDADGMWPDVIGGAVAAAVGALGALGARRILRRRRQHRSEDVARRGRCRPNRDRYTHRRIEPDLSARKFTSVELVPIDRAGEERRACAFDDDPLRVALDAALTADRVNAHRPRREAIAIAAERLADLALPEIEDQEIAGVQLGCAYEGSKVPATFTTWRCSPEGTWPHDDAAAERRWKVEVTDSGAATSGVAMLDFPLDRDCLARELEPLIAEVVEQIDERRHPQPSIHAHVAVEQ